MECVPPQKKKRGIVVEYNDWYQYFTLVFFFDFSLFACLLVCSRPTSVCTALVCVLLFFVFRNRTHSMVRNVCVEKVRFFFFFVDIGRTASINCCSFSFFFSITSA